MIAAFFDYSGGMRDQDIANYDLAIRELGKLDQHVRYFRFATDIVEIRPPANVRPGMTDDDEFSIYLPYWGGSLIEPIIAWVEANNPECVLVFSDGYLAFPMAKRATMGHWTLILTTSGGITPSHGFPGRITTFKDFIDSLGG